MVKHGLKSAILGSICHLWGAQSDHYLHQTRHLGPDIFGSNLHSHFGKASISTEHVQVNWDSLTDHPAETRFIGILCGIHRCGSQFLARSAVEA